MKPQTILRCLAGYLEVGLNPPPCAGCPEGHKCLLIRKILEKDSTEKPENH